MLEEYVHYFVNSDPIVNMIYIAILSFGESIIIPIPPDVLIVFYSLLDPSNWFYYSTISTVFSIAGGITGYKIGSIFSKKVEKVIGRENVGKVKEYYDRYGNYAIFLAGFSPIPYKVFTLSSGILNYDLKKFILYSTISRAMRFYAIGFLSSTFGKVVIEKLNDPFYIAITIIIGVGAVYIIEKSRRYLNKKIENREYGKKRGEKSSI